MSLKKPGKFVWCWTVAIINWVGVIPVHLGNGNNQMTAHRNEFKQILRGDCWWHL